MDVVDINGIKYGHAGYAGNYDGKGWPLTKWLCASCGARYEANPTSKTDLRKIHNGIKIVKGHIQQDMETNAYLIKQINTKAGPITISIRKKIYAGS